MWFMKALGFQLVLFCKNYQSQIGVIWHNSFVNKTQDSKMAVILDFPKAG